MFDEKTKKLIQYIESQLKSIESFDETAGKKGNDAKLATAHKKGYIEALKNVDAVIKKNMAYSSK